MATQTYDVGGILYPRPFRIRRLGHFGFNMNSLDAGFDFYSKALGFRLTDETRLSRLIPGAGEGMEDDRIIFMTNNTDHHAFLLAHRSLGAMFGDDAGSKDITLSQITWQVGTLEEVVNAVDYFNKGNVEIRRSGRDMPGSNWHVYVRDPDGHTVELYYGMEQIGLYGRSKPTEMYYRRFGETPSLPQMSDLTEAADARSRGIDVLSGYEGRDAAVFSGTAAANGVSVLKSAGSGNAENGSASGSVSGGDRSSDRSSDSNVGGILLPRPFKVTKIGPAGLFVGDLDVSLAFYRDTMGFTVTEIVEYKGHRCVFLRHGLEHHSLKLYPRALRAELGLSEHTSCVSMGMQVGSYRQLRDAVAWLKKRGVRMIDLPPQLSPGIDYHVHALDPEGHCIQLYYYMEQVGWDGKPRPAAQRRPVTTPWPEHLPAMSDTYADQIFQGPLG